MNARRAKLKAEVKRKKVERLTRITDRKDIKKWKKDIIKHINNRATNGIFETVFTFKIEPYWGTSAHQELHNRELLIPFLEKKGYLVVMEKDKSHIRVYWDREDIMEVSE